MIVSLDADFLCSGPGSVRYARDFADKRRVAGPIDDEPPLRGGEHALGDGSHGGPSLAPARRDVEAFARAVAEGLGVKVPAGGHRLPTCPPIGFAALVRDLQNHRGASLVIAGEQQPPAVHALAHAMNDALGNVGKTVHYTAPVEANPVNQIESLEELVADIEAGQVDTLVMLGVNPVFNAPADLRFGEKLSQGENAHPSRPLRGRNRRTLPLAHPEAHFLESWGDARAYDGT